MSGVSETNGGVQARMAPMGSGAGLRRRLLRCATAAAPAADAVRGTLARLEPAWSDSGAGDTRQAAVLVVCGVTDVMVVVEAPAARIDGICAALRAGLGETAAIVLADEAVDAAWLRGWTCEVTRAAAGPPADADAVAAPSRAAAPADDADEPAWLARLAERAPLACASSGRGSSEESGGESVGCSAPQAAAEPATPLDALRRFDAEGAPDEAARLQRGFSGAGDAPDAPDGTDVGPGGRPVAGRRAGGAAVGTAGARRDRD